MRISRNIIVIVALLMSAVIFGACASTKKSVTNDSTYKGSRAAALGIDDALKGYMDWNSAELSGKVKAPGLPVSVSLKVYMKRDSALVISARAILVGEVARVELSKDSLLMINKLKKVYCKESAERLNQIYPSACGEVQCILLGRMIVPGKGELSERNIDNVSVNVNSENIREVRPSLGEMPVEIGVVYKLGADGKMSDLIAVGENGKNFFSINYEWEKNGSSDITFVTTKKSRPFEVLINLDAPKWETAMPQSAKIPANYRRIGFLDFFKSF